MHGHGSTRFDALGIDCEMAEALPLLTVSREHFRVRGRWPGIFLISDRRAVLQFAEARAWGGH